MALPGPAPIVVFDLDETLMRHVPAAALARQPRGLAKPHGPVFPATPAVLAEAAGGTCAPPAGQFFTVPASRMFGTGGYFALRPGLLPLLNALREAGAQVVVWTHGSRAYAEPVVEALAKHVTIPIAVYCDAAVAAPGATAGRGRAASTTRATPAPAPDLFHRTVAAPRRTSVSPAARPAARGGGCGPLAASRRAMPAAPRNVRLDDSAQPRPAVVPRRAPLGPKPIKDALAWLGRMAPGALTAEARLPAGAGEEERRGPHRVVLVENSAGNVTNADRPHAVVVGDFTAHAHEAGDRTLEVLLATLKETALGHTAAGAGGPVGMPLAKHPSVMTLPTTGVQYLRV